MKMSQFHTYTFTNVIIDARQVAYSNNLSVHNSYQGTISLFHFSATTALGSNHNLCKISACAVLKFESC